jgi:hypothetical protein
MQSGTEQSSHRQQGSPAGNRPTLEQATAKTNKIVRVSFI